MNSDFIYNHVCCMTKTANEIQSNRCNMRKKRDFNDGDLEMLDFMMKVAADGLTFIHNIPDEVESDLKGSHPNWTALKEHLENQFKCIIEGIMNEKKTIKHRIAHEEQMEKIEQMRLKRAAKANGEGSN